MHLSPQQPLPASEQPSLFPTTLPLTPNADTAPLNAASPAVFPTQPLDPYANLEAALDQLDKDPNDIAANTLVADVFIEKNYFSKALEHIEKILAIEPDNFITLTKKHLVLVKLKRMQEASEVCDTALDICNKRLRECDASLAKNPNDVTAQKDKAATQYIQEYWQTLAVADQN